MAAEPPGVAPSTGEDIPPPLGTWARLYTLVLGTLAVEVFLLALLARAFA